MDDMDNKVKLLGIAVSALNRIEMAKKILEYALMINAR